MPEQDAARIGPDGAERLVEMLLDPEEARSHAQILLALGLCGSPDAMAAILAWSETLDEPAVPRGGEIDRSTFKGWQALPYALGHVARFDRHAVVYLEALMNADAPNWTFRHHRGARLRKLARRSAATSLGLTGLPEARRALDRAARDASDAGFEEHLRNARALHLERARQLAE
jgi:HEAT repeat protein